MYAVRDADQPEQQAVGRERERHRIAEQQEHHEAREHQRRHQIEAPSGGVRAFFSNVGGRQQALEERDALDDLGDALKAEQRERDRDQQRAPASG